MGKEDKTNEYEKIRNAKIAQNKTRLEQFGIRNIAETLTSFVNSSQSRKRKGNDKATSENERDMEIPDLVSETEQDDQLDISVFKKVNQSGGQRHVRYIPPRSAKKYINITKQRVGVNNYDGPNQMQQDSHNKEQPNHPTRVEGAGIRQKHNETKLTMADFILHKKHMQRRNEVVNKNLHESLYFNFDREPTEQDMTTRSQNVEYEEPRFDNDGDIPIDSEEDASFDSCGESEQVALNSQDLKLDAILEEKIRGPTMLHHVHMRPPEKRKSIIVNEFGQPIGPITPEENTVAEFSRFLGTIARISSYAPLTYDSWKKVQNKEKMWEYILMKYSVPNEAKDWVMKTIGDAWRIFKCCFKKKHYYAYKDDKTRWQNRSQTVPDADFLTLLKTWKQKSVKTCCSRNRDRRLAQKNTHTAGPKSFAIIREEMRNEHPDKEAPSLAELFERTRRRKEGKKYVDSYEDTEKKIEEMKNFVSPEDGSGPSDAFLAVMGKNYGGSRQLYGRGVCNKKLRNVNGETTKSYVVPEDIMESLKATLFEDVRKELMCEFSRLEDRQREIEEEHAKKKKEIENMQKDLDNERESMSEHVLRKFLEKIPPDVARQYLS